MKMTPFKLTVSAFVVLIGSTGWCQGADDCLPLLMGAYNVDNGLLVEKAKYPDEIATPDQLAAKGKAIAEVITIIGKPDVMVLEEVSTPQFTMDIFKNPGLEEYTSIYTGASDGRGIAVAVASKLPLAGKPIEHVYWDIKDPLWSGSGLKPTRPIVEMPLRLPDGNLLTVLGVHLPSKITGDWSVIRRFQSEQFLRKLVDEKLDADPDANVMIMGDFNTDSSSPEDLAGLRVVSPDKLSDPSLKNPMFVLNDVQGSLAKELARYKSQNPHASQNEIEQFMAQVENKLGTEYWNIKGHWAPLDQIAVSRNVMKNYVLNSFRIVRQPPMVDAQGKPVEFNPATGKGYSDHAPIISAFQFKRPLTPPSNGPTSK